MLERNVGAALLVLAAVLMLISTALTACSSGPQLVPATAPNTTHVTVYATSGGECPPDGGVEPAQVSDDEDGNAAVSGTTAVMVWVDNRSNASPETTGNNINAQVPITATVPINTGGPNNTTPATTPAQ